MAGRHSLHAGRARSTEKILDWFLTFTKSSESLKIKVSDKTDILMTPPTNHRSQTFLSNRGFTLVELLVVIAIVALLAALGFPALKRSIQAANQAKCMGNLRQIGALMMAYAADHDGMTVPAVNSGGGNFGEILIDWKGSKMDANYRINGGFENWRCPENRVQIHACGSEGGESAASYAINGWNREMDASGWSGDNRYAGNRLGNISQPSKLYMVTEAAYFRIENWKDDGVGSVPAGLYTKGPYFRYAHSGKVNMVFADGHGELLPGPLRGYGTHLGGEPNKAASRSNGVPWLAN